MKKPYYIIFTLAYLVMLNACAPIYKCGESKPEKKSLMGKRLKAVVSERDNLCANLALNNIENAELNDSLAGLNFKLAVISEQNDDLKSQKSDLLYKNDELTFKNNDLQEKYRNLISDNLSKTDRYNRALKAKSDELDGKEKLLIEREKSLVEMQKVIARQDSITKRLNGILRNALLGFNADELSVEIKNGKVYVSMSDKLLFKSGSSSVEDKGKDALKLLGDVLNKNAEVDILIEGHTDNVPIKTSTYKDNWDLSVARATSIVRILANDYKIAPTRMTASGKGEYFPKADNETAEGRAKNRRTEIILSPKLDEIMELLR